MVDHLIAALAQRGVAVEPFNMTVTDLGKLAINLVDAATVVFGAPTVLTGAHPNVVIAAYLTGALRPKLKHAAIIGSYGWGGKASEQIAGLMGSLKVEWLGPVLSRGLPTEKDLVSLDRLADEIASRHKTL
jgi:flavorubredoxin